MNKNELREQVLWTISDQVLVKGGVLDAERNALADALIILIRNAVLEWIPVSERLPDEKGQYDVFSGTRRLTDHWFNGEYFINPLVTHWMPPTKPPIVNLE